MARRFIVNRRPTSRQMDRQNPVLQPSQREGRLRRRIGPGQRVGPQDSFSAAVRVSEPANPGLTSGVPRLGKGLTPEGNGPGNGGQGRGRKDSGGGDSSAILSTT